MTKTLTTEQQEKINQAKSKLVNEILTTQDVPETYPTLPDGRQDFSAKRIKADPLTVEEISFLVDKYYEHRLNGMSHGDASRITYACCYNSGGTRFNPRARLEEIRKGK